MKSDIRKHLNLCVADTWAEVSSLQNEVGEWLWTSGHSYKYSDPPLEDEHLYALPMTPETTEYLRMYMHIMKVFLLFEFNLGISIIITELSYPLIYKWARNYYANKLLYFFCVVPSPERMVATQYVLIGSRYWKKSMKRENTNNTDLKNNELRN